MALETVDEYLAHVPAQTRSLAQELRSLIKKAAPKAEEKISYGMPYYHYHGRLIYFGAFKSHVGLYVMADAREALKNEIKPYQTSKATLHFLPNQPLPKTLIKKIITMQATANETRK